tara:strand:+ start:80 stop:310 length:231 start_codon:yes stop_codon:yes gene_type:complete
MDSQLKIDRDYIEEEIQRQYDDDKKEYNRLMKLLKETSDDDLSLKMWRVDQSFMDRISELGSDMVSELLDKLGDEK